MALQRAVTGLTSEWKQGEGFEFKATSVAVRLPDPIGLTVSATPDLQLDEDGNLAGLTPR